MADGYPVHNYGSDPLGRLGASMIESSLTWDEKQKLLEKQALSKAAEFDASTAAEAAKGGTLNSMPSSVSATSQSNLMGINDRGKAIQAIQDSKLKSETALIQAQIDDKKDSMEETQLSKWTKIRENADARGDTGTVTLANDHIDFNLKSSATRKGVKPPTVDQYLNDKSYNDWNLTAKSEEVSNLTQQAMDIAAKIGTGEAKVTDLAPIVAAADKKIQLYETKLGKDTFALYKDRLKNVGDIVTKVAEDKAKQPTYTTQTMPDGSMIQTEAGGKKTLVQGRAPLAPEKTVPPETTAALSKLGEMIKSAGDTPTPVQTELIKRAAAKSGYDFVNVGGKKSTYGIPFTDKLNWDTLGSSQWQLVPKATGGNYAGPLTPAAAPAYTAVNAKGAKITSVDGITWKDINGRVIK